LVEAARDSRKAVWWNGFDIRCPLGVGLRIEYQIYESHQNHKPANGSSVSNICLALDTNGMQMLKACH